MTLDTKYYYSLASPLGARLSSLGETSQKNSSIIHKRIEPRGKYRIFLFCVPVRDTVPTDDLNCDRNDQAVYLHTSEHPYLARGKEISDSAEDRGPVIQN